MKVQEYLNEVAYVGDSKLDGFEGDTYYSKFDGSYITLVGMEDKVKFLADLEITEELTHGVGFSPKDGKWYGWSHRAIYGFQVGSTCEKGNCHYVASTPEELIDDHADFFADISPECVAKKRAECQILDDRSGIRILTTPITLPMASNIDDLIDAIEGDVQLPQEQIFTDNFYTIECGKGAWVAQTMEDAKQMAVDFNEGVS